MHCAGARQCDAWSRLSRFRRRAAATRAEAARSDFLRDVIRDVCTFRIGSVVAYILQASSCASGNAARRGARGRSSVVRPYATGSGPTRPPARDPGRGAPRVAPPAPVAIVHVYGKYTVCNLLRITQNRTRWPGAVPFDVRARRTKRAASAPPARRAACARLPRPAGMREVCGPPQSNPCRSSHVPSTLPHEQNSTTIPRPVASGQPSAPEPVAHEHPLLSVSQTDVSALAHTAHIHSAHIQRGTSRDDPVTAPGFGLRRTADNTASSDILLPAAPSSLGISHPMQHAAR